MNVLVATEAHFISAGDGRIYSTTGGRDYHFWRRYLEVFDTLTVIARVKPGNHLPESNLATGPNVAFIPLPDYVGPLQYAKHHAAIQAGVRTGVKREATILRVPGMIGSLVWRQAVKQGQPYAVEVVGDPYDVFAPTGVQHMLRPLFRWFFPRGLRQQCWRACAAAYVTEHHLQMRYPPSPGAFVTNYSSVELPDNAFVAHPRSMQNTGTATLITVASLAHLYKGTDTLIEAFKRCVSTGLALRLIVVGDGPCRSELEARAAKLGLLHQIEFLGLLPAGEAIRKRLDASDLFVLPSRAEGLPRALIEAMARGLPCVASNIGGIPELLPLEDMVGPDDPVALADKITEVLSHPERMTRMSTRNLEEAKKYSNHLLQTQRRTFYKYVREVTEAWLKNQ